MGQSGQTICAPSESLFSRQKRSGTHGGMLLLMHHFAPMTR
jgi:hypothetical protein